MTRKRIGVLIAVAAVVIAAALWLHFGRGAGEGNGISMTKEEFSTYFATGQLPAGRGSPTLELGPAFYDPDSRALALTGTVTDRGAARDFTLNGTLYNSYQAVNGVNSTVAVLTDETGNFQLVLCQVWQSDQDPALLMDERWAGQPHLKLYLEDLSSGRLCFFETEVPAPLAGVAIPVEESTTCPDMLYDATWFARYVGATVEQEPADGSEELVETAFGDPAGWADGGLYAGLDPAALFSGTLPERAAQADPACDNPLTSDLAFVLSDGDGLAPEEAAAQLTEALLTYYGQDREGCPFRVTDWTVGEQELLGRAELRALAEREVLPLAGDEAAAKLSYLQGEYPYLPEGMWCLRPSFGLAWEGELDTRGAMPPDEELVADPAPDGSPGNTLWVLVGHDGQWWLQRSAALTALLTEE